ncbi:putative bifunctional diguanylate cyclase/phosphodiesterase [Spirilliplanes yamanashiensis]|uniref:Diguanylate cyclase/phosphodiesterase n=1 Tax=Spirilliplanes yamanashiensis TaxID=42233 RepID=A0A8J4DIH6_9ACTN|nr:EAL domain-containing protein [Spirilliplanes yamanashiensis]MDP9819212.1 diguanylate cyclase (GGDEF)-like protein [Spirilliplanes yamanashiensis]GIJ01965.1 hypothetical protein Sya03_13170 [Spirilliplanes yamanashiensis]
MTGAPATPRPPRGRGADPARLFWLAAGLGCLGIALLLVVPPAAAVPLFLLLMIGCGAGLWTGVRRHATGAAARPWRLLSVAILLFLGGLLLRAVVPGAAETPVRPVAMIPDALVLPGYLLIGHVLLDLLRRRRPRSDEPARLDAVLIGLGVGLLVWSSLIAPMLSTSTSTLPNLVNALFPIVDVVLLTVGAHLLLSGAGRTPAVWLLTGAVAAMFCGDLMFAVREDGRLAGLTDLHLDALFVLAFLCVALAALHPSAATLADPQPERLGGLSVTRTATLAAVLVTPALLTTLSPPTTVWNAVVRTALSVALTAAVVFRIVRSNNSRARAEATARHQATHDALTDLPNRELLAATVREWGARANADGQEISLLFLDIDRFKLVNDHWGHRVGDELLCAVAGRLASLVRDEDLVCRVGGDEFVIAMATTAHRELAESLAGRLVRDFERPFRLSVGDVVVTPSIGVARAAADAGEALELIRDADTAMYEAKDSGRNRYALFDSSLREKVQARMGLEQALRGAAERGELSVHYQPIVDAATDELTGFEALMRWQHPELGTVSPLRFIPVAEDTGLIVAHGAWLLEEAAAQLVRWRAARPGLHVSVNLAVRQLREPGLADTVRDVLARTGLPAEALWLEITESGFMEDLDACLRTLGELRALGVTLCIDDFGTGYSSLSYLGRLPVGVVKVDRAFIRDVGAGGPGEPIVRAVVAMSHALGHQVVAEGVETEVQRDWLRALGCDLIQGYLYGPPRPAEVAERDWIAAVRPGAAG